MSLSHLATRRVDATLLEQCARSGQMDSRQIAAHVLAGDFDQDEPIAEPGYMLAVTAVVGLLSLACIVGGLTWLVYSILPVLRAHFA